MEILASVDPMVWIGVWILVATGWNGTINYSEAYNENETK